MTERPRRDCLFFFRLVCVGLFLFVVTSVSFAASPPVVGPTYQIEASFNGCAAGPIVSLEQKHLGARTVVPYVVAWFIANAAARAPAEMREFSSIVLPLDGSCVTAIVFTALDGPFTVHVRVAGLVYEPPADGTVSDYTVQDILVMGLAFLSMCVGWVVGAKS